MSGIKTSTAPAVDRPPQRGCLYLVSTPIGNLEDISLRALRILREARVVACEDTRQTGKLLRHHGIATRMVSYHDHNERRRAVELVAALERGEDVALVSDAGTPLVSDPGFRLVNEAIAHGVRVVPVPGASAVLGAMAASGLPCDEFLYAGFLPPRRGERRRAFQRLHAEPRTIVLFETPHRLAASLADAVEILGNRSAVVCREITKVYEEFRRGTLSELAAHFAGAPARGEITLVIAPHERLRAATAASATTLDSPAEPVVEVSGADAKPRAAEPERAAGALGASLATRVAELMRTEALQRNAALKRAARELGLTRREAYRQLLSKPV